MTGDTYRILVTPAALKQIDKLDRQVARRIGHFLQHGIDRSKPRSSGKPLVNRDEWRYRVGDYRILCSIDDRVVTVLVVDVGHRREIYR